MTSQPHCAIAGMLLLLGSSGLRAEWPLVWDFDGRDDQPVAARLGSGGDLWVLTESYTQGQGSPRAVLLRIAPDGGIVWATADPGITSPTALALRDDGSALAIGHFSTDFHVTAFNPSGAIEWSRSRSGLAADTSFSGPRSAPIWDEGAGVWRVPAGVAGDFAVLSYSPNGDALPNILWSPPAGEGRVSSLLPRAAGGLLVSGPVENLQPPGWWTVALDAAGAEIWKQFDDGGTPAGIFSGSILLSADPVRVWADDETLCGLFSLRLWALDAVTGAPLWDATWPTTGLPGCDSFTPDSVTVAGDRIVAAGVGNVASAAASFDPIAVSFDAAGGETEWARAFNGATNGIRAEVTSVDGTAFLASTLFPQPNPGPTRLWLSSWDREGAACRAPVEVLSARVSATFPTADRGWLLVGYAFSFAGGTADDLVVQKVSDPCAAFFADGFESDGTTAWSLAVP